MFRNRAARRRVGEIEARARRARRLRPAPEALEDRKLLSTFTVTRFDVDDAATEGTLRWALASANANAGPDTIDFDPAVFDARPGRTKIVLTAGQLVPTDAATTTIAGPAAYRLTISGNRASRVFLVDGGPRWRSRG